MDQTGKEKIQLRHSKDDKKQYRKRKKGKKNRAEQETSRPCKVPKSTTLEVQNSSKLSRKITSRAHTIVRMAVSRNPRSTFLTPNLRSALLPTRKGRNSTNHQPRSMVPELNRSMLSCPGDKDIVLGEGTYGMTRLMKYNGSLSVAVKEYKGNDLYEVKKEAGVISELQRQHHPNLPFILGVCLKEKPYLMITQFYGRGKKSYSLSRAISREIIKFHELSNVFKQIVDALQNVHETGWLHNDIKENNVLMHNTSLEWKPVVIDFGKSRPQTNPKKYKLTDNQKAVYKVKHPWIAPELIEGTHAQSQESDVYSLGVLFQNMLGKFIQRNYSIENLAGKCTAPQPTLRISLKQLKDELK
ncbi:hypothetical protein OS493_030731 [Desmophyllum pertusum]|uniref:Protein kinase domain-containing protein n=1 Tax=Desmophyllum pertusum TaxID=174260 RepID=A0A9W9Z8Z8_9CNID|nr:hypothetical protein OS493_030731 [Desmophyllum pertusum]